jgi:hypothetical protein
MQLGKNSWITNIATTVQGGSTWRKMQYVPLPNNAKKKQFQEK